MGIHDVESFLDALATESNKPVSDALRTMRYVMQVEDSNYTKTSKGAFTVYRISTAEPADQIIYVLINGREAIYEIAGHITDGDFNALLSGLALSSVH